jgi:N-dimethylarginine dimethylaminohydrolase
MTTLRDDHPAPAAQRAPAVWSCDEFSPLREVVVGRAAGARLPDLWDRSAWLNLYPELSAARLGEITVGRFPDWVIEETEEDLDSLAGLLRGLGVVVHRPAPVDHDAPFATPYWSSPGGFSSYCPRDVALVVGSTIVETPSPTRARLFEAHALAPLFRRCLLAGAGWIAAPKPQLRDELYGVDVHGRPVLGESEPVFEAANVLRCGRDLLYQVSGSGNELGRVWFERTMTRLGQFRVHPLRGVYPYTHIDSTIALLRPGLVLLNPARVRVEALPAPLRRWDRIWCPPMCDVAPALPYPLSSPWLGMNLLMVTPGLALVDAAQTDLIAALEHHHIDVIPHRLRHTRVLGGGVHCVTLDLAREGELTDYFT